MPAKTNTLAEGLMEITSIFDETESKSVHTKKNAGTNRNKRSKTLNEIKPVEKHKNCLSFQKKSVIQDKQPTK